MPVSEIDTAELERKDRLHPATAGLLMGAIGGAGMLAVAGQLVERRGGPDLVGRLGAFVGNGARLGASDATTLHVAAFVTVALAGAVIGALYALVTRHLRRYAPLLVWSLVFFGAVCTLLNAFVVPRWAPRLRADLPFSVSLVAAMVFAFVVSLELPVRRRGGASRLVFEDLDEVEEL